MVELVTVPDVSPKSKLVAKDTELFLDIKVEPIVSFPAIVTT